MDILRFATAGSVDDGKSTLIGRLLYDSKGVFLDQIEALQGSSTSSENGINLALFTDGLKAEREQGITIDVAYRYFSTNIRKFIIADTPGHFQYTRNMFTGASNSDLTIILIDARKGVLEQSKRHFYISWLLGIRNIIVAVNKMDLIEFNQEQFNFIKKDFLSITKNTKVDKINFIPISALNGDNVVSKSKNMPWYKSKTLIELLETAYIDEDNTELSVSRFPVQLVNRIDNDKVNDFRGFMGTLNGKSLKKGQQVLIYPSKFPAKIKDIIFKESSVDLISNSDSATIVLDEDIDISRGDIISNLTNINISNIFKSRICWMDEEPLDKGKKYLLKHSHKAIKCIFKNIISKVDMKNLDHIDLAENININDIGIVEIEVFDNICFDSYKINKETGSFIIIDLESNNTVAAGIII